MVFCNGIQIHFWDRNSLFVFVAWNTCFKLLTDVNTGYFISITVQRGATQSSLFIILQVHSACFGCQPHTSSGVHKTVTTASRTGHIFCAATSLQRSQAWPLWREGGREAVVTVLCTPDDECGWHPKYVARTCRIINRLLFIPSRWTIINIDQGCTEP